MPGSPWSASRSIVPDSVSKHDGSFISFQIPRTPTSNRVL